MMLSEAMVGMLKKMSHYKTFTMAGMIVKGLFIMYKATETHIKIQVSGG